jgi:hypothetical protein
MFSVRAQLARGLRRGVSPSPSGLCDYTIVLPTDLSHTRKGRNAEPLTSILWSRIPQRPQGVGVLSNPLSTLSQSNSRPNASVPPIPPTSGSPITTKQSPFTSIWHNKVLPVLDQRLPALIGNVFSIDVVRDLSSKLDRAHQLSLPDCKIPRIVHFSSPLGIDALYQDEIKGLIVDALPEDYRFAMTCKFHVGSVKRCCDCGFCGTGPDNLDASCAPKRTHHEVRPVMGASIAVDDCRYQGTLGGYVLVNSQVYLGLTNNHIFEDDREGRKVAADNRWGHVVRQPAQSDSPETSEIFGELEYASGNRRREPVNRTRSHGEEWVVMDWCTIRVDPGRAGANIIVKDEAVRNAFDAERFEPLLQTVQPNVPNLVACGPECKEIYAYQKVHTVGRTSGYQIAQVTDGKSSVHFNEKHVMHEWGLYIDPIMHDQWEYNPLNENVDPETLVRLREKCSHQKWTWEGPGQPGDSGSWVIDRVTGALCGMIFARGPDYGDDDRVAYFSDIQDIIVDMKETIAKHNQSLGLTPDDISIEVVKPNILNFSGDIGSSTTSKEILQQGSSLQDTAIRVPAKHSLGDDHDFLDIGQNDLARPFRPQHWDLTDELESNLESFDAENPGDVNPCRHDANLEGPIEKKEKGDTKPATLVHRSRATAGMLTNNRRRAPPSFSLVLLVR